MNKLRACVALAAVLLFLSGCKFDLIAELRLRDVRIVGESEDTQLFTQANLEFSIPSDEHCKEYSTKLVSMLEGYVLNVDFRSCEADEHGANLVLNFRIPVINGLEAWQEANLLFGIVVIESDLALGAFMANNLDIYQVVARRLSLEFGKSLNMADSKITVLVRTFLSPETIFVNGVFANDKPMDGAKEILLKRRERISIQLSNVGAANLAENGASLILFLKR